MGKELIRPHRTQPEFGSNRVQVYFGSILWGSDRYSDPFGTTELDFAHLG